MVLLNAEGQWYERQYHVSDINQLSKTQLELTLVKSKNDILTASLVGAVGGISWALLRIAHEAIIISYISAGVFVGGAIVSFAYLQRITKIKSTLKRNYPATASLNISPALILNKYSGAYCSGMSLKLNF
jgi:type III secretory pathway component EscS